MRTRTPILITAALLALAALTVPDALAPSDAAAQPAVRIQPAPGAPGAAPAPRAQPTAPAAAPRAVVPQPAPAADPRAAARPGAPDGPDQDPPTPRHMDQVQSSGKGTALLFWAFALATVGGALFVVTRRNLIAAVMGMVGSFLGIAAVYMMLYAGFLSVIQMLVYAGAIMVLFVFVIMILNRPEDEPVAPSGRIGQVIGGAAILYLVVRLAMVLVDVKAPDSAMGPPGPVVATTTVSAKGPNTSCDPTLCASQGGTCTRAAPEAPPACRVKVEHEWGSVKAVGTDLFGPGVFPFEAISILLLVAVVGAIAIARPLHEDKSDAGDADADAGGAA